MPISFGLIRRKGNPGRLSESGVCRKIMNSNLENILNIRYVKLHFTLMFTEDTNVPQNKASALRGGIGEMLLRANCIRDRKCEGCDFKSECIVQRIMYSKFEKKPAFVTEGESIGYVVTCRDYRGTVQAGDRISFELLLLGKNIVYLNQYLQAIYALGQNGIGKDHAHFVVSSVTNTKGEPMLENGNIYMERYQVENVSEYVAYRMKQLVPEQSGMYKIEFQTPITVKYQNDFLTELHPEAFMRAVKRRIYMLDCFENIDGEDYYYNELKVPDMIEQDTYLYSVNRMSFRKSRKITLKGLRGYALFSDVDEEQLALLLAGELVHIGKNTSFGFGKYRILKAENDRKIT